MRTLIVLAVLVLGMQDAPKKRGFLGAQVSESDAGLKIDRVVAGSPAEKAGLKAGDFINTLDGAAVTTQLAFVKAMGERGPGGDVRLQISRDGESREIKIVLAAHPQDLLEEPDTAPGLLKVRRFFDLPYDAGERQKVNLVLPVTDKPFPTVMWIHAGA